MPSTPIRISDGAAKPLGSKTKEQPFARQRADERTRLGADTRERHGLEY